jgi:hypothetical protein
MKVNIFCRKNFCGLRQEMLTATMHRPVALQALFSFIQHLLLETWLLQRVNLKIVHISLDVVLVIRHSVLKLSLTKIESCFKRDNYYVPENVAFIIRANCIE